MFRIKNIQVLKSIFYVLILYIFFSFLHVNADSETTYNEGSYNGMYIKTFTGGETHIFSAPSLIINDNSSHEIELNISSSFFAVDGTNSLPGKYYNKSDTANDFDFIPTLLYKGPNCGVQTDQEIVDFIISLRDSYNIEPFKGMGYYAEIFEDYDYLISNFDDFDKLKTLGQKINKSLKCDMNSFKTSDIFPISCGLQDGTFDFIDDETNVNETCLFKYEGTGSGVVRSLIGSGATKGLEVSGIGYNEKSNLEYKVFSYKPFKLHFDYKAIFGGDSNNFSYFKLYINDIYIFTKDRGSSGINNYNGYSSMMLPSGLNTFRWEFYNRLNYSTNFFFDNIDVECIGGGVGCGITDFTASGATEDVNGLEDGDILPWDVFTFSGTSGLPWMSSTWHGRTGKALHIDYRDVSGTRKMVYTKTLTDPAKLEFYVKADLSNGSYFYFNINGIRYYMVENGWSWDDNTYHKVSTPLLPAGDYVFEWISFRDSSSFDYSIVSIDDIKFTCIGGGAGCGLTDFTASGATEEVNGLEEGDVLPWDLFTFSGTNGIPWMSSTWHGRTGEALHIDYRNKSGNREMVYTKTLTDPAKLEFYVKADLSGGSYFYFDINGLRYTRIGNGWSWDDNTYHKVITPLLSPGTYTFKWISDRDSQPWDYSIISIDDIKFSCIGGGGTCGLTDFILSGDRDTNIVEKGPITPGALFNFSGTSGLPWGMATGTGAGSQALYIDYYAATGDREMSFSKNIGQPYRIEFDVQVDMDWQQYFYLYIDGIIVQKISDGSSWNRSGFHHYISPMLTAGNHTFKFVSKKTTSTNDSKVWIDNIEFTCIGGGTGCGIIDFTASGATEENNLIERGDVLPWNVFTFSGTSGIPWKLVSGTGAGSKALYIDYHNKTGTRDMSYTHVSPDYFRIEFDAKFDMDWQKYGRFYINGVEQFAISDGSFWNNSGFHHYTSQLLPAGTYTFRWSSYKATVSYKSEMWIDNIEFTCIGGGTLCGIIDFTASGATEENNLIERGDVLPWDVFTFSGTNGLPWTLAWGNGGGRGLRVISPQATGNRDMIYNKTLLVPMKIRFDTKTSVSSWNYSEFFINGVKFLTVSNDGSWDDNQYHTWTSPLLEPGNYTFTWRSIKSPTASYHSELSVDNIRFLCVGGAGIVGNESCGWADSTLEKGPINPFDLFQFTGSYTRPWAHVTGEGNPLPVNGDTTYAVRSGFWGFAGWSNMIYTGSLSSDGHFSFYIQRDFNSTSSDTKADFSIYDVTAGVQRDYKQYLGDATYIQYMSPQLPAGDYIFTWRSYERYTYDFSQIWIDDIVLAED